MNKWGRIDSEQNDFIKWDFKISKIFLHLDENLTKIARLLRRKTNKISMIYCSSDTMISNIHSLPHLIQKPSEMLYLSL